MTESPVTQAANMILVEQIRQLIKERDDALVDQKLIEELWERRTDATEMQEQIKLLRKERDEARREVCELTLPCLGSQTGYAKGRGWDCYKEETP